MVCQPGRFELQHVDGVAGRRQPDRRAVESGAATARGFEVMAGDEVANAAFLHAAVRAVGGGGERQAEVGDAHLGIVAAIDGVDDDHVPSPAVVALTRLLRDQVKAAAAIVFGVQLPNHDSLGQAVDEDGAVAARALALRRPRLGSSPDARNRRLDLVGNAPEDRKPALGQRLIQKLPPRMRSMSNTAVEATSITAIVPAWSGSLTTRSATFATDPAIRSETTRMPAAWISLTATVISPPIRLPASTRPSTRGSRATALTASAISFSPTRGMVSTEIRSPRMLWRSASLTAPMTTPEAWAPAPTTMTRRPKIL